MERKNIKRREKRLRTCSWKRKVDNSMLSFGVDRGVQDRRYNYVDAQMR